MNYAALRQATLGNMKFSQQRVVESRTVFRARNDGQRVGIRTVQNFAGHARRGSAVAVGVVHITADHAVADQKRAPHAVNRHRAQFRELRQILIESEIVSVAIFVDCKHQKNRVHRSGGHSFAQLRERKIVPEFEHGPPAILLVLGVRIRSGGGAFGLNQARTRGHTFAESRAIRKHHQSLRGRLQALNQINVTGDVHAFENPGKAAAALQ